MTMAYVGNISLILEYRKKIKIRFFLKKTAPNTAVVQSIKNNDCATKNKIATNLKSSNSNWTKYSFTFKYIFLNLF